MFSTESAVPPQESRLDFSSKPEPEKSDAAAPGLNGSAELTDAANKTSVIEDLNVASPSQDLKTPTHCGQFEDRTEMRAASTMKPVWLHSCNKVDAHKRLKQQEPQSDGAFLVYVDGTKRFLCFVDSRNILQNWSIKASVNKITLDKCSLRFFPQFTCFRYTFNGSSSLSDVIDELRKPFAARCEVPCPNWRQSIDRSGISKMPSHAWKLCCTSRCNHC